MKKRRISIILIIVTCSLVSVSCRKEENIIISLQEYPKRYERIADSIDINAEIVIDENADEFLYANKALRIEICEDQLVKGLMAENTQQNEVFKIDKWTYADKKGKTLSINGDSIAFISGSDNYRVIQKKLQSFNNFDSIERTQKNENTDTSQERIELENQLSSWGLEDFKLQEELELNKSDVIGSIWCGYERYQGLLVFSNKYYNNLSCESAPLQIIKSKDVIEKMQLLYGYKFIKGKEKILLKTFDEIANSLEKEYSMIISDNQYEAVKAELALWVNDIHDKEELDMEPVWIITIHEYQKDNKVDFREYQEIYSAITAHNVG